MSCCSPRIISESGGLVLAAGQNKNISLRTSGTGKINVNLEDLSSLVAKVGGQREEHSGAVLAGRLEALESVLSGLTGDEGRIVGMESQLRQLTQTVESSDDTDRRLRKLKSYLVRLKRRLDLLEERLGRDQCQELRPCRNGARCVSTFSGYFCQCPPNWQGETCDEDVDECARFTSVPDLGCQNGATCLNTHGSYRCVCAPGYYGVHCRERTNSCSSGTSQEMCGHGQCVDTATAAQPFTCLCEEGWTTSGDSPSCTADINECARPDSPCSRDPPVTCINTEGSFQCGACPVGYTGNGYYCTDINECLTNNGGCSTSPRVDCLNTRGSRQCGACPAGYSGDGSVCVYLGACHISNGGCSLLAACVETANIVRCFCPPGYVGPGVGPLGCTPGSGPAHGPVAPTVPSGVVTSPCASQPCQHAATCIPTASSFLCHCASGYQGLRCEERQDFCQSQPCQHGGTCLTSLTPPGYTCECPSGFTGDNCQEEVLACGGDFSAVAGFIDFPVGDGSVYDHSLSCDYTITVEEDKVVNMTFSQFQLEGRADSRCDYDWLAVYDGPTVRDALLGRFCGDSLPGNNGTIISTRNVLFMEFRSDHSVADHGFHLSWDSVAPVCGGLITGQTRGTISSPGYPGRYPHNSHCTWTIQVDPGKTVQFHFALLNIESHPDCSYDKLEIIEASNPEHVLATYCNATNPPPPPLTSSSHEVMLRFTSDSSRDDTGFLVTWAQQAGCGRLLTEVRSSLDIIASVSTISHREKVSLK